MATSHARPREILAERLVQASQCPPRRGIPDGRWPGEVRSRRVDMNDRARSVFEHPGHEGVRRVERREVGSPHHGSRLGWRRVLDIFPLTGTRGVDDHVGYTVLATHPLGQGQDLLAVRGIARLDDGMIADTPGDELQFGKSTGHEDDAIARLRQVPRRVRADSARRAGDQREFHVRSLSGDEPEPQRRGPAHRPPRSTCYLGAARLSTRLRWARRVPR